MSIPAESANSIVLDDATADLLFREARTANTFTDEGVSKAQVEAIYDLIKWGPTAFNAQTLRVVIVESPEAKARLIEHLGDANKAKTAAAPLVAILAADTDFHENIERVLPNFLRQRTSSLNMKHARLSPKRRLGCRPATSSSVCAQPV